MTYRLEVEMKTRDDDTNGTVADVLHWIAQDIAEKGLVTHDARVASIYGVITTWQWIRKD